MLFNNILNKIKKSSLNLYIRPFEISQHDNKIAQKIFDVEKKFKNFSDDQLKKHFLKIKKLILKGMHEKHYIVDGFALVREAANRVLGQKHYKVQILAGISLFRGNIAEMAAGEGKTLTATLPLSLWALHGKGAHIATTNEYLAQRDFYLMEPVFEKLGLRVGLIQSDMSPEQKKESYEKDITYGTGYEFGFDYLRDQLASLNHPVPKIGETFLAGLNGKNYHESYKMQRGHAFILIDEVDSVLLDEARSPLVISGSLGKAAKDSKNYYYADMFSKELNYKEDFLIDLSKGSIEMTSKGEQKVYRKMHELPLESLKRPWISYIVQALRANVIFRKDIDYIIQNGKIVIVDESTGRAFSKRNWQEGLHQAIEAKEKVTITEETVSLARITRQRYISLYKIFSGMTGTACGSEIEFWKSYKSPVLKIPLNKKSKRKVLKPLIFNSLGKKWDAVEKKIIERHRAGQPILIGTRTITDSENIAKRIAKHNFKYELLNAKQDGEEANIIEKAGQRDSITIATNMAGRGADIILDEESILKNGLFVLGTQMHESARVDNQLIGRCARQGNPGVAQFFISIQDDLIEKHDGSLSKKLQRKFKNQEVLPDKYIRYFNKIQNKVENKHFQSRQELYDYDNWLEEVIDMISKQQ